MPIYIRDNLRNYMPAIHLLLNGEEEEVKWDYIALKYRETQLSRKRQVDALSPEDKIFFEACFLDIVARLVTGDRTFVNLVRFINTIFLDLIAKTDERERKLLPKTIYNMLVSMDARYLNYVGELAVLNNLKSSGFVLQQTEEPLVPEDGETTTIDFTVKNDKFTLLVEVYNIQGLDDIVDLTADKLKKILIRKLKKKRYNKQKGSDKLFYIVPVIWAQYSVLKMVHNCYEEIKNEISGATVEPSAFVTITHKVTGETKILFGAINNLILQEDNGENDINPL